MPVVRRYPLGRVRSDAAPDFRPSAASTPASEGAGLARAQGGQGAAVVDVGGAIRGLGKVFYDQALDQQQRDAEFETLAGDNQLTVFTTNRLYDPTTGALAVTGKNAKGLADTVLADFDTAAGEIEAALGSGQAQERFSQVRLHRRERLELDLRRHEFDQTRQYEAGEVQAKLERVPGLAAASATEPARVAETLREGIETIRQLGARVGLGPEQQTQAIEQLQNATHVSVLGRMIDLGYVAAARVYFEETASQITPEAQGRIEKALQAGSVSNAAKGRAAAILAGTGTATDKLEQAGAIEDKDVRAETINRVKYQLTLDADRQQQTDEQRVRTAYDILDRTKGNYAAIPASTISLMSGAERSAAEAYAKRKAKGEIATDWAVYQDQIDLATDPDTRAQWAESNLLLARPYLAEAQYLHLSEIRKSIREQNLTKTASLLRDEQQQKAIVDDALRGHGFDPSPPEKGSSGYNQAITDRVIAFRRSVREWITAQPEPPTDTQVQAEVDRLMIAGTRTRMDWLGRPVSDVKTFAFEATPETPVTFSVDDLPAPMRAAVEAGLRRANVPVTPENILSLFLYQTRGILPARPLAPAVAPAPALIRPMPSH